MAAPLEIGLQNRILLEVACILLMIYFIDSYIEIFQEPLKSVCIQSLKRIYLLPSVAPLALTSLNLSTLGLTMRRICTRVKPVKEYFCGTTVWKDTFQVASFVFVRS